MENNKENTLPIRMMDVVERDDKAPPPPPPPPNNYKKEQSASEEDDVSNDTNSSSTTTVSSLASSDNNVKNNNNGGAHDGNDNNTTEHSPDYDNNDDDYDDHYGFVISQAEEMNPARRNTMEDRSVIHMPGEWNAPDPDMAYIGVYDGHGGREIVDFLDTAFSFHVAEELAFEEEDEDDKDGNNSVVTMETRLIRAFLMADLNSRQAGLWTSGATVALCLLKRDPDNTNKIHITTANVGDSRVVLGSTITPTINNSKTYTTTTKAERLSYDHRVTDPLEIARIQQAGGFVFKGRVVGVLAVTRSIGDHALKNFVIAHPHVHETTIDLMESGGNNNNNNKHFLIIACDGLWDVLSDDEAVELVCSYEGDKTEVAGFLIREALRRGTTDNVTVVVVWLERKNIP